MDWILASASPRRKELLGQLIEKFEIIPAQGEERTDENLSPEALVKSLAKQKATEVATYPNSQGKIVLGADTVVVYGGKVLGKPKDEEDAFSMLSALSGREHDVYTGVCIVYPTAGGAEKLVAVERTQVRFYPLSEAQIRAYIATGSPMDKAGAYGIQDGGLVESIQGSFSNVVGLPIELCVKLIQQVATECNGK